MYSTNGLVAQAARTVIFLALGISLINPMLAYGQERPDLSGVWSSNMTTPDYQGWQIEDYGCFFGCAAWKYQRLRDLVRDPANDERPFRALNAESDGYARSELAKILTPEGLAYRDAYGRNDAATISCVEPGFVEQALNPLPLRIRQTDIVVELRYEARGGVRVVYMDERDHPADAKATLYGHSIGHYENSTLVVETISIMSNAFPLGTGTEGGHSDQLRTVERYTRSQNGKWLRLEFSLEDPVMLFEPLVYEKVWAFTPDIELFDDHNCESISGQR